MLWLLRYTKFVVGLSFIREYLVNIFAWQGAKRTRLDQRRSFGLTDAYTILVTSRIDFIIWLHSSFKLTFTKINNVVYKHINMKRESCANLSRIRYLNMYVHVLSRLSHSAAITFEDSQGPDKDQAFSRTCIVPCSYFTNFGNRYNWPQSCLTVLTKRNQLEFSTERSDQLAITDVHA